MYDFRDTNQSAFPLQNKTQIIINSINLDEQIKGYRTLAVYGRELMSKNITTTEFRKLKSGKTMRTYVNKGGSANNSYDNRFLGSYLASRTLRVDYDIKAKNSREFIEIYELLNYHLDQEQAPIIFTDDSKFYWVGTLANAEIPEINNLSIKSSFEIECSNPFKTKVDAEVWEFDTRSKLKKVTMYPVQLEKMKIKVKTATNKLIIKNLTNAQSIILDAPLKVGDTFEIDFKTANINKNLMQYLNLTSDLEEFEILYNDEIMTSVSCDVGVAYREVRL